MTLVPFDELYALEPSVCQVVERRSVTYCPDPGSLKLNESTNTSSAELVKFSIYQLKLIMFLNGLALILSFSNVNDRINVYGNALAANRV